MTRRVTYFNPRTPVGCDHPHAALWSASIGNFNPRTPVGCDRSSRRCARPSGYFNPRTPVGCDRPKTVAAPPQIISIHAPQWGATVHMPLNSIDSLFQSTHPSGVRQIASRQEEVDELFQSTHPSGVRPVPLVFWFANSQFQSTHPSGVRLGSAFQTATQ